MFNETTVMLTLHGWSDAYVERLLEATGEPASCHREGDHTTLLYDLGDEDGAWFRHEGPCLRDGALSRAPWRFMLPEEWESALDMLSDAYLGKGQDPAHIDAEVEIYSGDPSYSMYAEDEVGRTYQLGEFAHIDDGWERITKAVLPTTKVKKRELVARWAELRAKVAALRGELGELNAQVRDLEMAD